MSGVPHPRASTFCLGHGDAERAFAQAVRSDRLPHAWLLRGRSGIGKATLAYRLVRRLLCRPEDVELCQTPEHAIFRMVAANAYPDLHVIERQISPRTGKLQKDILVDAIRGAAEGLRNTSARGRRRVLLIDAADNLNGNAANALLKLLEEPPADVVILLVCHRPAGVPRTLLSRCTQLRLRPLSGEDTATVLARLAPAIDQSERQTLSLLADGSPGTILAWHEGGFLTTYRLLVQKLADGGASNHATIDAAEFLAVPTKDHGAAAAFEPLQLLTRRIALVLSRSAGAGEAFAGEHQLLAKIGDAGSLDHWAALWEKLRELSRQVELLNLDARQALVLAVSAVRGNETALRAW